MQFLFSAHTHTLFCLAWHLHDDSKCERALTMKIANIFKCNRIRYIYNLAPPVIRLLRFKKKYPRITNVSSPTTTLIYVIVALSTIARAINAQWFYLFLCFVCLLVLLTLTRPAGNIARQYIVSESGIYFSIFDADYIHIKKANKTKQKCWFSMASSSSVCFFVLFSVDPNADTGHTHRIIL